MKKAKHVNLLESPYKNVNIASADKLAKITHEKTRFNWVPFAGHLEENFYTLPSHLASDIKMMWRIGHFILIAATAIVETSYSWLEFGRNDSWSLSPFQKIDNRSLSYRVDAIVQRTTIVAAFYESGTVGAIQAGDETYQAG